MSSSPYPSPLAATHPESTVLERVTDAFFAVDGAWRFTYVNARAAALLRQSPEALLGRVLWEAFPEALGSGFERAYRRSMCEQVAVVFEDHFAPLDLWVEVNAYPGPDGLSVYFRDIAERRRAEAERRRREQEFAALADHAPDIIQRLDRAHRFGYVNAATERETGLPAAAFIGRTPADPALGFAAPLVARWRAALESAFRDGAPQAFTTDYAGPHGVRWFDTRLVPERDDAGAVESVLLIARDVTAQRQAEAALREREARLRDAQEIAGVGSWNWDVGTSESTWSDALYGLHGLVPSAGPMSYERFLGLVHPEDRARVMADIADAVRTGESYAHEYRIVHPDGSLRTHHCRGRVTRGADGAVLRVTGSCQDVTERARAEAALRESEERFRLFVEHASDVLLTLDHEARFSFVSPAMERTLGHAPAALCGTRALDLVHPDDRPTALAAITRAFAAPGSTQRAELRVRDASGAWRPCEAVGRTCGPSAAVSGLIVTLRDRTEWHAAESARRAEEARFRALIEHAHDVVGILTLDGRVLYESPAVQRVLGCRPEDLVGRHAAELVHPDDFERLGRTLADLGAAPGARATVTYRCRHADGSWRTLEADAWNLTHEPAVSGVVVNARDITERAVAEAAVRESEERFRALSASSPMGIFQSDLGAHITYANPRLRQIWGAAADDVLGACWTTRVHPDDRRTLLREWRAALAAHTEYEADFRIRLPDGTTRFVRGHSAPLRDASGKVVGSVGTIKDVTARQEMERALAESEGRLRLALSAARMVAWDLDLRTGALHSDAATDEAALAGFGGVRSHATTYDTFLGVVHPDDRPRLEAAAAQALAAQSDVEAEFRVVLPSGAVRWRHVMGRVVLSADGVPGRMVGVGLDVTDRKTLEQELTRQAHHDALTGLANRTLFRQRVEGALARAAAEPDRTAAADVSRRQPAVLLVDLDDFKTVNDSLGHESGDRLLTLVTARLLDATRGSDVVARLGGDEFAILLGAVRHVGEAARVAERVVAALTAPFPLAGREVRVGASVGIALAGTGDDPDALLRNADLALYRAKGAGKNRHETFAPAMHADAVARLELEAELRRAIDGGELTLHYQPIVALATGEVTGLEALVRWKHPARGLVSPAAFIPLAETTGLIVPLGRWVLEEACRTAATRAADCTRGVAPLTVAVNVSGRQFQHPGLLEHVAGALRASGLAPQQLVLEVTESVLLTDVEAALGRLEALRALGVQLALDDFGTGYSSLAYLQRLPVDILKIDRTFVADLGHGGRRAALARAVVTFANALGLRTVAEGIETTAQRAELAALGCDFGQGYLFAMPLEVSALERLLHGAPGATTPTTRAAHAAHEASVGMGSPSVCSGSALAEVSPGGGSPAAGASTTVLVVDDEARVRGAARRTLERAGYHVVEATDGADALRRLASASVSIVLTDVVMPELGGPALADALTARSPAPRVVLMSGFTPADLVRRGVRAPVGQLLQKPFTPEELLDAVRLATSPDSVPRTAA